MLIFYYIILHLSLKMVDFYNNFWKSNQMKEKRVKLDLMVIEEIVVFFSQNPKLEIDLVVLDWIESKNFVYYKGFIEKK